MEHVRLIQALSDPELRKFELELSQEANRTDMPKWYGFHIWWNSREVKREWQRRA
jgi:hypothetical protein